MDRSLPSYLKLLFKYSAYHWIYSLVGGYFLMSVFLFAYFNIDIGLPCIFKLCIGINCPGCGLTHAFSHIIRFEFLEAWEHNKLAFVVLPSGLYYIGNDFRNYCTKNN